MRLFCLIFLATVAASCTKEKMNAPAYSEAVYRVSFTGTWQLPQLTVPANAHFTPVIGMVHNSGSSMYTEGMPVSAAVEAVAEDGNAFPLLAVIDSFTAGGKAASAPIVFTPSINSSSSFSIYCNSSFPLFSCISMLAPTPDWFLGISSFNLQPGGKWITDTLINVYAYDAGTEQGDVFGQNNPPTTPQQPAARLNTANAMVLANGNATIAPVATLRFVRQ